MRKRVQATAIVLLALTFGGWGACPHQDKVVTSLNSIIAAATVDSIIQSNNATVVALDVTIIDDAGQTIDLWVAQPHSATLITKIADVWTNLLKSVKPEIEPTVHAIIMAIKQFVSQLQAVPPAPPTAARSKASTPKLSAKDNATVTEMRAKLRDAKAKLSGNPVFKK